MGALILANLLTKTLLILGAGSDQVYPIKIAHDLGLRVISADSNPSAQGFKLADEAAVVSNRDVAALKNLCDDSSARGFPVSGILVMGTDIPQVAAELAIYLGVPGPSVDTGIVTTNKFLMKQRLEEFGIAIPWFRLVNSFQHLCNLMREHGGTRYVIKPTDRSGARGVYIITFDLDNLEQLYNDAVNESIGGQVILEEFIEGDQISTESILLEGKAYTPGFVDRNYEMLQRFAPSVIENGGTHPSKYDGDLRSSIKDLVERSANALGIINGVAKGDVVIAKNGTPMLIEMASRLSGGDFSESLIPIGCGVNIVKVAIQIAIGVPPCVSDLNDVWETSVANRYFFSKPGRLVAIHGVAKVRNLDWVKKLDIYVTPGDYINEIKFHSGRLGVFIVVAENRTQLDERIKTIYETVTFEVE